MILTFWTSPYRYKYRYKYQGISSYIKVVFEQSETLSLGVKLLSLLPFFFTWFIFTLIYTIVPNKKVDIRYSACGALIAAIFFTLGKQAFTWYITTFPSYQLIIDQ